MLQNSSNIQEENNFNYLYELFKIIYNDFLHYPNYSHFFNIENVFKFIFLEHKSTKKKENESEENKNLNFIKRSKLNKITVVYEKDKGKIKSFGEKFIENNKGKGYIYQKFLNELENINDIIKLPDDLENEDKKEFFRELMENCQFTKEEFYSNNKNEKIELLCELNDKGRLKIDEENFIGNIEQTLRQIFKDLEGDITIKNLEEFLGNEEKQAIKRLKLINIIMNDFVPEQKYIMLKKILEEIKAIIKKISWIKNSLLIFHRIKFQIEIRDMINIIKDIPEKSLNNFKDPKTKEKINNLMKLETTATNVEKVKDFLLFKVLYDEVNGNDQEKRFNIALNNLNELTVLFNSNNNASLIYEKNKAIFDKVKEKLNNDESKVDSFIKQMTDYFAISEKKELIDELTLIFKSKIFERDLKSTKYFFENTNYHKNNYDKFNEKISNKNKRLTEMNLAELKNSLKELKDNGIYDYKEENKKYCGLFSSLYEKKEAIEKQSKKKGEETNYYDDEKSEGKHHKKKNTNETQTGISGKEEEEEQGETDSKEYSSYEEGMTNKYISKKKIKKKLSIVLLHLYKLIRLQI